MKSIRPLTIAIVMLGLAAAAFTAQAADRLEGWKRLGEKIVDHRVERDEILVGVDDGIFNRIKLEVKNADVEFLNLRIIFASGEEQDVPIKLRIKAGGETRAIDLDGHRRHIRRVIMLYKTDRDERRRAVVVLYGHR